MGAQTIHSDLIRGHIDTMILRVLLDGDSCDRGFGGEGQAATRMEAFLEVLEGMA